jgi:hypothetical protein
MSVVIVNRQHVGIAKHEAVGCYQLTIDNTEGLYYPVRRMRKSQCILEQVVIVIRKAFKGVFPKPKPIFTAVEFAQPQHLPGT